VKDRLRPLGETECYAHCYGAREGNVRIVKVEPRRGRHATTVSGEHIRRQLEARMGAREAAS
jgi:hypothetical protein